ncbi:MAG: FAD:protein FMN transferase [Clostridia bacterium]|nr:FAD:protein FMN transferase [Clostridia bacterium]
MKKAALVFLMFALTLAAACAPVYESRVDYAMGAEVTQKIWGAGEDCAKEALAAILALEEDVSYRKNGAVALLNSGKTVNGGDAYGIIVKSVELWRETGGAYDITVLPLVRAWGFDTDSPRLPGESEIASALSLTGSENVVFGPDGVYLANGAQIDLSAAGKGAACQKAVEIYKARGASGGVVTVGGSVGVFGSKNGSPFRIAVRSPFDPADAIAVLTLTDTYISTSGSYEKRFEKDGVEYHHLLDPSTGCPVQNGLISVTVVCSDGALSDMLSSACFCMGMEKSLSLLEKYSASALFVREDGAVFVTKELAPYVECESYEVLP